MKRLIAIALLVAACSGRSAATEPPEPADAPEAGAISQADYGADWPFTVSAGTLYCYETPGDGRMYVTFGTGDGIEYALNGSARDFGFPELDETILKDFPDRTGTLDLIERGLALC